MRIMWVINSMIEEIAKESCRSAGFGGGWILSMLGRLRYYRDAHMHLVVFGKVKEYKTVEKNNVRFHIFPDLSGLHKNGGGAAAREVWRKILENAAPDIIHVYGTEQPTCIELVENFGDIPTVVSLQGILREYYRQYYGSMEFSDIFCNVTLADIMLGATGFFGRRKFGRFIPYEDRILHAVRYVEGRTSWDRAVSLDINPSLKYYDCKRMLREVFYTEPVWDLSGIQRHTIFTHQGNYAIKGLHVLIEAVAIVKREYPDVILNIAGQNPHGRTSLKSKLGVGGYSKFIIKKIKKLGIEDNIKYLGPMGPDRVKEELMRANVMAAPSSIENSSNSIAESMITGTPCVAGYVGGNPDMLGWGEYGILYPYNDPVMLANAISSIFRSDELAKSYSDKAREAALKRHNRDDILENIYGIYSDVIADFSRENGGK